MQHTSVTSKGQVTIPKKLRQQFGIHKGSKLNFIIVDDHIELQVVSSPASIPDSGFAMLKSQRIAVPVDFDPASLLSSKNSKP
ncbi:MAG TPA: hypothetical protein DD827_03770 [Gammaproteobacteria bacterium]|nr:hypothetical protein [Gammaproteobacteria bacterium]